jgi:cyclophilin family peptidyl-prolyl cis-trans isomerase
MPTLPPAADPAISYRAVFETSEGDITCELFAADSPQTVGNFVGLARAGFYDGGVFHRVIKDFMIQGGCPNGVGTGGPGYQFADEFNDHRIVRGSLAMANAGPNTNGSQFFIVTAEATPWLDGAHTNFGRVVRGQEVVDAIGETATDGRDRPVTPIRITTVRIQESPAGEA